MKQKTLLFILFLLSTLMASADVININDIYYNLDFSTKTAEVTRNPNNYIGSVDIPASVTFKGSEYSVTSIGSSAFSSCKGLTSVTIPNSVTSIGEYAFYNCSGLTKVELNNNSIASKSYSSSSTIGNIFGSQVKEYILGNDVTSIGNYAFYGCSGLTEVTIGNSVTTIGDYAFLVCSGLTSVTIPNSVTSIGERAFGGCKGLTEVTIPNSVTSIGGSAFSGCSGLTKVTIPNSVPSIGGYAFSGCSGLKSVHITDIEAWCKISFYSIDSNPLYYAKHLFMDGKEVKDLIIPDGVTSIGNYAFPYCSSLTSVEIPNSVTSIGSEAFDGCSSLTSVTIPNSVTSIGYDAFRGCSSLTSVTIPNSVTSIGGGAFSYCSGLTSVSIGNSVTTIGDYAFLVCSGLTKVTIPNSVTEIGENAFSWCSGLTSVIIPNSVTEIGENAFSGCFGLNSISVESGNTKYDSRNNCNAIIETSTNTLLTGCKNTFIPNSVTSIGKIAFHGCSGLTSVTIPNSVTSIGYDAFRGCSSLKSVSIGNSVTTIGGFAFFECSGLTLVSIGNSVTSIGNQAFYGCSGLTDVYCYAENVPSTGSYAFIDSPISSATLHVPAASKAAYKAASPWKGFGTIKEIIYLINGIYYNLESNAKQAVVISGNTKYTGSITIPETVTYNDVTYRVTSIGNDAFRDCPALISVTIPNSVTSIGNAAFANCIELAEVYCYAEQIPTTGNDVFKDSYINYVTLHVPASAVNAYKTTAPWSEFGSIVALALRGDVNGDGKVNGTDIQEVINVIVEGEYDERADVNKDGTVNGTDIQEVINIIVNGDDEDEDIKLEKAGVRFGFYETIPGYSVRINKINVTGLGVAEFGSDIIGSTIGTSTVTRTLDRADGNFTNVYFKDANEDTEMVVEVDFTLVADDGSGETINQKATTTVKLQDLIQWQSNRNYTFIYKILLAPLYMTEDVVPAIYFDSVVVDGQEGTTR